MLTRGHSAENACIFLKAFHFCLLMALDRFCSSQETVHISGKNGRAYRKDTGLSVPNPHRNDSMFLDGVLLNKSFKIRNKYVHMTQRSTIFQKGKKKHNLHGPWFQNARTGQSFSRFLFGEPQSPDKPDLEEKEAMKPNVPQRFQKDLMLM